MNNQTTLKMGKCSAEIKIILTKKNFKLVSKDHETFLITEIHPGI